jgi:flagellar export protein FliJ
MKALRTLLKVAERDLETLRRALGEQIQREALIEERIRAHDQQIRAEQQHAMKDYESQRAYGGFVLVAQQRRKALESEREMVAAEIARLRTLIAEAHVEARKFERLIELEEARAKAAAEKRENAELDEFATLRAGRQKT